MMTGSRLRITTSDTGYPRSVYSGGGPQAIVIKARSQQANPPQRRWGLPRKPVRERCVTAATLFKPLRVSQLEGRMRTRLTQKLGIQHPIISAPMGYAA